MTRAERKALEERFWAKVDKNGPTAYAYLGQCWIWTGSIGSSEYGNFAVRRSGTKGAHRISYILENGPIPKGLWVRHLCNNPPCVNPRHLITGTPEANVWDKFSSDRQNIRSKETHYKAKLDSKKVLEIKARYLLGMETLEKIAADFGTHSTTIYDVLTGKTWGGLGKISSQNRRQIARVNKARVGRRCNAKLQVEQVREIKVLLDEGRFTKAVVAKRFGVSPSTINDIARGITWNEIGP